MNNFYKQEDAGLNRICELVFHNLLPGDKPLMLYMEFKTGCINAVLAMSRAFNNVPYDVDLSDGVILTDSAISAAIRMRVNSDGYIPKDGKTLWYRFLSNIPG